MILNLVSLTPEGFIFATGIIALILLYYRPIPMRNDPITVLFVSAVIVFIIDDLNVENMNLTTILASLFITISGIFIADLFLNYRKKIDKSYELSIRNEERIKALYDLFDNKEFKDKMTKTKKKSRN